MSLEAAKECVSLQLQILEEKWDRTDSQCENTSDCDETVTHLLMSVLSVNSHHMRSIFNRLENFMDLNWCSNLVK